MLGCTGKRTLVALVAIAALASGACTGSVTYGEAARRDGVLVLSAPPAPRVEARPSPAPAGATWIVGHWEWENGEWSWQAGRWEPSRAGHVYVRPRWVRRGRGWVRLEGGWQPRTTVEVRAPRHRVIVDRHGERVRRVVVRPAD